MAGPVPTAATRDAEPTGGSPEAATAACVHVAILHYPLDTRIFHRECRTLAAAGHEVHLVVPDPPARAIDGIRFHACAGTIVRPPLRGQWSRFLRASRHAFALHAPIYHLHEPHLVPLGLALKLRGAKVVYDVHEDYPAHARTKLAAKPLRRTLKPLVWRGVEAVARRTLDGFVCATPAIARRFPPDRTWLVQNFPRLEDFEAEASLPWAERENVAIYAGDVKEVAGIWEMLAAAELVPAELGCRVRLLGEFRPATLKASAERVPGWARVSHESFQPFHSVVRALGEVKVGLALFHPHASYLESQPTKLFEYMAAGLPAIVSDFPYWRQIVSGAGCGLTVDPRDPGAIAEALAYLFTHPDEAEAMGRHGRDAVEARYNWTVEAPELLALYDRLAPLPDERTARSR